MTYRHQRALGQRFADAWNMIAAPYPTVLIKVKPADMLVPRDPDYLIGPVAEKVEAERGNIETLARQVAARAGEIFAGPLAGMNNSQFWDGDAVALYALVQAWAPPLIVEIGCGNSTRIVRKAITEGGLKTQLHSIDPMPRAEIAGFADRIERASVLNVDPAVFAQLKAGDVLFLDGSHYCFNGSDATYLFLEIFPKLAPGVIVHVHDIMLPYEYHEEFSRRHYNEQYLLGALVLGGMVTPVLPVWWASRQGWMPTGGSFWGKIAAR